MNYYLAVVKWVLKKSIKNFWPQESLISTSYQIAPKGILTHTTNSRATALDIYV